MPRLIHVKVLGWRGAKVEAVAPLGQDAAPSEGCCNTVRLGDTAHSPALLGASAARNDEEDIPVAALNPSSAPSPNGGQPDCESSIRRHVRRMLRRATETAAGSRADVRGDANGRMPETGLHRHKLVARVWVPPFDSIWAGVALAPGIATLTGMVERCAITTAGGCGASRAPTCALS